MPTKALELIKQFPAERGITLYEQAYKDGRSVSAFLNQEVAQDDMPKELDGFERMMMALGIRQKPVHEYGMRASTVGEFWDAGDKAARALFPEWVARQQRRVSMRALYTSQDRPLGTIENAYTDNMIPRWDETLTANIGVAELVAMTTPVDSTTYRSMFLVNNASQQHMSRVAEGADIPEFKLVSSNVQINLFKYGGALLTTYEQLRRMTLDMLSFHLQRMAIQAEVDKVAQVIDVLIAGDGNANTAAEVVNLSTLDAAASGVMTLKAWVNFKLLWENPYTLTTALGPNAIASQLYLLPAGTANIPLLSLNPGNGQLGAIQPINSQLADAVRLGNTSNVGTNKLLGFDRRLAVERLYEIGANISEVERFIRNQTELLTMTETEGYQVLDRNAAKIIDLAA